MPIDRQHWRRAATLDEANMQLVRICDVLDQADRADTKSYNTSGGITLTWPRTLIESDTTAGAVTLTFPAAGTVPGFRIDAVKTAGANVLTVNSVAVATFAAWQSTGVAWRRVG